MCKKLYSKTSQNQARLMLGFMFTTMFLSMWISNTATTAMMLPIVDAVAEAINDEHAEKQQMAPLAEGEEEGDGVNIQFMMHFCSLYFE